MWPHPRTLLSSFIGLFVTSLASFLCRHCRPFVTLLSNTSFDNFRPFCDVIVDLFVTLMFAFMWCYCWSFCDVIVENFFRPCRPFSDVLVEHFFACPIQYLSELFKILLKDDAHWKKALAKGQIYILKHWEEEIKIWMSLLKLYSLETKCNFK